MLKSNSYLYQLCGIIVLLCGYLFTNTPDSLSEMYFNPKIKSVFTKAPRSRPAYEVPTKVCSKNDSRHKSNVQKHISVEVAIIPQRSSDHYLPEVVFLEHSCALKEAYNYLFYEEINPPPPKLS